MDIVQAEPGIFPSFSTKAVEDKAETIKQNRPIFRDVEWIEIRVAGDRGSVVSRKLADKDRIRFQEQYDHWKQTASNDTIMGTPLSEWSYLSNARAAELKSLSIHTLEALAEVPDTALKRMGMDGRELREKAKVFLEQAQGNALEQRMTSEMMELKRQNEELAEQVKALQAKPKRTTAKK